MVVALSKGASMRLVAHQFGLTPSSSSGVKYPGGPVDLVSEDLYRFLLGFSCYGKFENLTI